MDPAAAAERRATPPLVRHGGRRWSDDPDLNAAVERILVQLSVDLNAARDLHDWSQDEMGHAAGIAPNTVLGIEKARIDPHISTVVRMAYAAGYDVRITLRKPVPARPPQLAAVNPAVSASSA
jgi:DNA-binding XRE family transcriptional regulator